MDFRYLPTCFSGIKGLESSAIVFHGRVSKVLHWPHYWTAPVWFHYQKRFFSRGLGLLWIVYANGILCPKMLPLGVKFDLITFASPVAFENPVWSAASTSCLTICMLAARCRIFPLQREEALMFGFLLGSVCQTLWPAVANSVQRNCDFLPSRAGIVGHLCLFFVGVLFSRQAVKRSVAARSPSPETTVDMDLADDSAVPKFYESTVPASPDLPAEGKVYLCLPLARIHAGKINAKFQCGDLKSSKRKFCFHWIVHHYTVGNDYAALSRAYGLAE